MKTKKTLSGTSKNGMEYHYLVNNKEYPTLKAANAKVATYKIAPKVFKVENYPNGKQSKRTIKVKGQPGRYTIL
jgi:peptidase E